MSEAVYKRLTDQIIAQIEKGSAPWQKPWIMSGANTPKNFITKKPYRGFNLIATGSKEFQCPYWLTFKQIVALGGQILPNSSGTPIVYWLKGSYEKKIDADETEERTFLSPRYYVVFNLEQVEGIEWEMPDNDETVDESLAGDLIEIYCEEENIDLTFTNTIDRAYYSPSRDLIHVPAINNFKNPNHFYSVLFHESVHSTGISKRLNRGLDTETRRFGDHLYSKEELVAEFGACFLMGIFDIHDETVFKNSASYLAGWVKKLKDQPQMLVSAANQAQRAVDFITKNASTNTEED